MFMRACGMGLMCAMVLSGCGGGGGAAFAPSSPTVSAPSPTPPPSSTIETDAASTTGAPPDPRPSSTPEIDAASTTGAPPDPRPASQDETTVADPSGPSEPPAVVPDKSHDPSRPAPVLPAGSPSLHWLQNWDELSNWWHERHSFPELVDSLEGKDLRMVFRAYGNIGDRAVSSLTGVSRTFSTTQLGRLGQVSHPSVTNLPRLDDIIDGTEDFGAVLFIPLAINHDLSGSREYTEFGGWMDHSFFFLTNDATGVETAGAPPDLLETETYVMGVPTRARPAAGGASWWGAMVGVDHSNEGGRYGRTIAGKAFLQVGDFSDPNSLSVQMLDMIDTTEGKPYDDIVWREVEMDNDGHFTDRRLVDGVYISTMRGYFYGPNGDEVGGMFFENGIAGAFGASRAIGAPPDE